MRTVAQRGAFEVCRSELFSRPRLCSPAPPHGLVDDILRSFVPAVTDEQVWTFARHDQRLALHRRRTPEGFVFVVDGDGPARSYFFRELDPLSAFHRDMEWFLLRTGWTLVAYSPERRVLRDRRKVLRSMISDRRRTMFHLAAPGGAV